MVMFLKLGISLSTSPVPAANINPAGPKFGTGLAMPFFPWGLIKCDGIEELLHAPELMLNDTIPSRGIASKLFMYIVVLEV